MDDVTRRDETRRDKRATGEQQRNGLRRMKMVGPQLINSVISMNLIKSKLKTKTPTSE